MMIQLPNFKVLASSSRLRKPLFFAAVHACRRFSQQLPDFDPNIDYYKALGLKTGASDAEIKKQYYKLA